MMKYRLQITVSALEIVLAKTFNYIQQQQQKISEFPSFLFF